MLCARIFYQCMILFRRLPLFSLREKKHRPVRKGIDRRLTDDHAGGTDSS